MCNVFAVVTNMHVGKVIIDFKIVIVKGVSSAPGPRPQAVLTTDHRASQTQFVDFIQKKSGFDFFAFFMP